MAPTIVFAAGSIGTLLVGFSVVWYLRWPLRKILVELCGNEQRAEFWTAFSAVALGLVPAIFAMACRPTLGSGTPAVFDLADQLKWGMIGLIGTLLILGWVIGRTIVRWETRVEAKNAMSRTGH
jgi:hypothetical protein